MIKFLNNIKITTKVTTAIILLGSATALVTAGLSFKSTQESVISENNNKLVRISEAKSEALTELMEGIESDLKTQSQNPTTVNAINEFSLAWTELSGNKTRYLQGQYITQNPHPTGSKEKLDFANDGTKYSEVHAAYHPYFRSFLEDRGYYDVFLFDTEGDLIYSVFKELDFATNVVTGQYAQSDLGQAYRAAMSSTVGHVNFFDFKPYAPSNNAPASFVSTPVVQNGETVGVLVFQMPVDRLNATMAQIAGLGETGQSYLVGEDLLMRSDSRFSDVSTILKKTVDIAPVKQALAGEKNIVTMPDYRNIEAVIAYSPVSVFNTKWAVVTQQDQSEVYGPLNSLKRNLLIQLGLSILILAVLGWLLGRTIAKPISRLGNSMLKVAGGHTDVDVPYQARRDEIGEMASSLRKFRDDLGEAAAANQISTFKGSAFDGSAMPMIIVDRDFNVTYVNEGTKKLFRDYREEFKEAWPNFNPDEIVGSNIDMFHKNPEHQRKILADASRLPISTDIGIGNLKFHLSVTGIFDRDGEYVGNVLQWEDVTSIRTNAGILGAIDVSQALIEFTLEGMITYANKNFLDTVGYGLDEIVGKHHRIFVDPEYAKTTEYSDFWGNLRNGEVIIDKFQRFGKTGNTIWLDAAYNSIKDTSGKPYKVIKIASDITQMEKDRREQEEFAAKQTASQAQVVSELASSLKALSEGDLADRIDVEFDEEYDQLRVDFNSAVETLNKTMNKIMTSSVSVQNGAIEMSQASDDLSKRTENQAAALEETAAALDEVTSTVQQTAKAAQEAQQVVISARQDAESGGKVVGETVDAMGSIKESSEKISQIIGVIDEIAFQTNLLALNAGVEAARAGEAGRGFAVVASEVRALAQRSSDAAKDIKELISASAQHVQTGVSLVDQTGTALDKIVTQVANVDKLVTDIASSASEQATGLGEVNSSINEMDRVTQRNAAMVEESTAACHSLTNDSNELIALVRHFKTGETNVTELSEVRKPTQPAASELNIKDQQKMATAYFDAAQGGAAVSVDVDEDNDWLDF